MKIKVGDKVKFLNDVGGGVITKIISPTLAEVCMEDGFSMPMRISELLPAQSENLKESVFNQDFNVEIDIPQENVSENLSPILERESPLPKLASLNAKSMGIYLAYVPHDQIWLLKDDIDIFLVNYTALEVLYTFTIKQNDKLENIDYGQIQPFSKILIQTINREDLENYLQGFVQLLFFQETSKCMYTPENCEFKVKPVRFFKEESFLACNFMEEKSLLIALSVPTTISEQTIAMKKDDSLKMQNMPTKPKKELTFIDQYSTNIGEAEIDLHIESLVDNHSTWSNAQIMEKQKETIIKALESAISEHYKRLIFIHGVGNFVLKKELINILQQYSCLHYFDAPMHKYGRGATEVLIKNNKTDILQK